MNDNDFEKNVRHAWRIAYISLAIYGFVAVAVVAGFAYAVWRMSA